jgi:hypothetical protein
MEPPVLRGLYAKRGEESVSFEIHVFSQDSNNINTRREHVSAK